MEFGNILINILKFSRYSASINYHHSSLLCCKLSSTHSSFAAKLPAHNCIRLVMIDRPFTFCGSVVGHFWRWQVLILIKLMWKSSNKTNNRAYSLTNGIILILPGNNSTCVDQYTTTIYKKNIPMPVICINIISGTWL